MRANPNTIPLELMWRKDRSVYRVWRTSWPGDAFEVVEWNEFEQIQKFCSKFNIPLTEAED